MRSQLEAAREVRSGNGHCRYQRRHETREALLARLRLMQLDLALEGATQEERERRQAALCHAEELTRARLKSSIERGKAYTQPLLPDVQRASEEARQAARRVEAAKARNSALSRTMQALGRRPGAPRGLEKERQAAGEGQRRAEARLRAASAAGFAEQAQALQDIEAYLMVRARQGLARPARAR